MANRLDLVIAASNAAGPCPPGEEANWKERVAAVALELFTLADTMDARLQRLSEPGRSGQFTAVVIGVTIEESSTRGVLTLLNGSADSEQIRTDRGDTDAGRAMIERARALIGHRVRVYRYNEPMASNKTYAPRVVVHLSDLGVPIEPIASIVAKNILVKAAENDTAASGQAWQDAGLPASEPVTAQQLAAAFQKLPGPA